MILSEKKTKGTMLKALKQKYKVKTDRMLERSDCLCKEYQMEWIIERNGFNLISEDQPELFFKMVDEKGDDEDSHIDLGAQAYKTF